MVGDAAAVGASVGDVVWVGGTVGMAVAVDGTAVAMIVGGSAAVGRTTAVGVGSPVGAAVQAVKNRMMRMMENVFMAALHCTTERL